jgi:hypothetical protein
VILHLETFAMFLYLASADRSRRDLITEKKGQTGNLKKRDHPRAQQL